MRRLAIVILSVSFVTSAMSQPAFAIKQFYDEFVKLYKSEDGKSDFDKLMSKAKCFCCHQGRKSKKNHNRYGAELAKLLDKKKDKKKPEKIIEALKKVEQLHLDSKDKKSPTYGKLIKAGKLPGGELAEAKKEPKKKEEAKAKAPNESEPKDSK